MCYALGLSCNKKFYSYSTRVFFFAASKKTFSVLFLYLLQPTHTITAIASCTAPVHYKYKLKYYTLTSLLRRLRELSDRAGLDPTCPVSCVVEVHSERTYFMLSLPGWRRAVLIVSVSVVVVDVLPRQNRGARRAAHGCCHEGIDEMSTSMFHDPPCFIHHLHRPWKKKRISEIFSRLNSQELTKTSCATSETRKNHLQ